MNLVVDLKVVMDTNVFISGVFFSGPPYQILKAWQSGTFELVVSQELLNEYQRVGQILAEEHPSISLSMHIYDDTLHDQRELSKP